LAKAVVFPLHYHAFKGVVMQIDVAGFAQHPADSQIKKITQTVSKFLKNKAKS
jgi:hypothetical protein